VGLSLEFYAGDAAVIGADFSAINFDGISNGSRARAYADFSLHLAPKDLDLLSEVFAERAGVEPLLLSDSLLRTVGGFEGAGGAEVVDPAWVGMVAVAEEANAPDLAAEWIRRVGTSYDQQFAVTPEAVRAVRELIRLCRLAIRERVEVVHSWYL
jgi:hypothetical protein